MKGILPCFRFHVRGQLVTWFLLKAVKTDVVCTHGVVRGAGSRDPSLRTPGRPGAMNPLTPAVSRADSEQSPAGTVYRREQQTPAGPPLQPLYNHSYLCKLEPTAVEFLPSTGDGQNIRNTSEYKLQPWNSFNRNLNFIVHCTHQIGKWAYLIALHLELTVESSNEKVEFLCIWVVFSVSKLWYVVMVKFYS